ncbi:MAG: HAMP domain-containing histidine kinase, partial [Flavobacteriales bacterium]|nr:HAMP domain-containing histidine kinase [Flavobacteriales bacterium]
RTWDPDAPDAGPRLQRFTAGMVQQIDALSTIASEFSSFAQMPRAQATDLDLREVVRAAVDVYHGHPQVRFTAELPEPLPVHADREHLLRVFNNLLLNALQAIPEEREGLVEVHGRVQEGRAVVSVTDNGTGISEADRERIFRPNFTTKGSGTGLGLAMVKRLVENAGGSVHYETEEGMGTTFRVELPLRR